MSTGQSAKQEILSRIREALPGDPEHVATSYAGLERLYRASGQSSRQESIELLLDRLVDYDTEILEVADESEISGAIAQVLLTAQEEHVLIPADFPAVLLPEGFRFTRDHHLNCEQIEEADAVVTTCEIAVANTGTIFIVHEGSQGRRVLTLLPDHHVCLVRRDQVVHTIPEAFRAVNHRLGKPVTTISGPSATSDIEMIRIRGVHGPRRLTVILYS